MSETKAIEILAFLGGKATTDQLRKKAFEVYPDTQLYRIIHTPLKELARKGYVKQSGKLVPGPQAPEVTWTIVKENIERDAQDPNPKRYRNKKLVKKLLEAIGELPKQKQEEEAVDDVRDSEPKFKTAAELLQEEADKYVPPEKPEKVILEVTEKEVREKMEQFEINPEAKFMRQLKEDIAKKEPTVADAIREAIDEPYLDKLKDLAENVETRTQYRGRHDIMFDILRFLRAKQMEKMALNAPSQGHEHARGRHPGPKTAEEKLIAVNPTHIMYGCRLSVRQMAKFMGIAMKNGLVDKVTTESRYLYRLTDKGLRYANTMDSIKIDFD